MIAIPGMCPGVVIKAGGGAGGGSGAGGGKGKGRKKGAGSGEGEENAEGGKKNASDCGTGNTGGCTKHSQGASAGDPVDVSTGAVFTNPVSDLKLSGPIEIDFQRRYSSTVADIDDGLGFGWCHTFGWVLREHSRKVSVRILAKTVSFVFDLHPTTAVSTGGWVLSKTRTGFELDTNDHFVHHFDKVGPPSKPYLLTKIRHRNGNLLTLTYDNLGNLYTVIDAVGRPIYFDWYGRSLRSVRMTDEVTRRTIVFAAYEYDEQGNLIRVTDADGGTTEYAYDALHRLTHTTNANGLRFHFRYDQEGRCVESWGNYLAGNDPAIDPEQPTQLFDGTPIRGIHHVRLDYLSDELTQVSDTSRLRTYEFAHGKIEKASSGTGVTSRRFDHRGNMLSHTSPEGHTWHYEWDFRGHLESMTDPYGHRADYIRNDRGDVVQNTTFSGDSIEQRVDSRGNPVSITDEAGNTTLYEYDQRGLMTRQVLPDGSEERYATDHHANLSGVWHPDGSSQSFTYDGLSRLVEWVARDGVITRYKYTDGGRLLSRETSAGESERFQYDPVGNLTAYSDYAGTTIFKYGGFNWPIQRIFPNGESEQFFYNWEGWLVREVNERGESRRITRDSIGGIASEVSFDHRSRSFSYDAEHRLIAATDAEGQERRRELDAYGNPLRVEYSDGTEEVFEYDARQFTTKAQGPGGAVAFLRDKRGRVVQEVQEYEGITSYVSCAYDGLGRRVAMRLPNGQELRFKRNVVGQRERVDIDGKTVVREQHNALGQLTTLRLATSVAIQSDFDGQGRLLHRELAVGASGGSMGSALGPYGQVQKSFEYAEGPNPIAFYDSHRGTKRYEYDARERLLALTTGTGKSERFAYDATSNLFETGIDRQFRRYGVGNRLLRRGNAAFTYNDLGQLVEKRTARAGKVDRVWTYEWNTQQQLAAVEDSDGVRVEFTYDPLSRRTSKKVFSLGTQPGVLLPIKVCRYVWFDNQLIQEREFHLDGSKNSKETITTYLYEDGRVSPFAQQTNEVDGDTTHEGPWLFYVRGQSEAPEELVDAQGNVLARFDRTAFGVTQSEANAKAWTSVRFEGQFEDVETGLCYNRYRYYDPDTGRYLNHDPVNTRSGSNLYRYCPNPIAYCDPHGLEQHALAVSVRYRDEQGNLQPQQPGDSGNFTSGKNTTGEQPHVSGTGKGGIITDSDAHTEPQAMNWLKSKEKEGKSLKGAQVEMSGESPPCKECSKRMRAFANESGATVEYTYPVGKKVKYAPGAKESPKLVHPQDDPGAKNLCDNYNKLHDRTVGTNEGVDKHGKGIVGPTRDDGKYDPPPQPRDNPNATPEERERRQKAVDEDRAQLVKEREAKREKTHRRNMKKIDKDTGLSEQEKADKKAAETKRHEELKAKSKADDQALKEGGYSADPDHSYRSEKAIGNSDKATQSGGQS